MGGRHRLGASWATSMSCSRALRGARPTHPPQQSGRLSKGLWLVWEYEGDKTLAYYLKRRDMERALAEDLGVEEAAAVPTVMKQIFKCLVVRGRQGQKQGQGWLECRACRCVLVGFLGGGECVVQGGTQGSRRKCACQHFWWC